MVSRRGRRAPPPVSGLSVSARLEAARLPDELVVPILPDRIHVPFWGADTPWPASLAAGVLESARGFRHRPENVVFAALAASETADSVVELGAGSGSLLLTAIAMLGPTRAVAIEIQPLAADRLRRTLSAHGSMAEVVVADLRDHVVQGPVDLVVANPPFYPPGWGRPSAEPEVHASTHALHGDVGDFMRAAARLVAPQGAVWFVYDAGRLAELFAAAGSVGLGLSRMVWIPDARAGRVGPTRVWARFTPSGGAPIERLGGP